MRMLLHSSDVRLSVVHTDSRRAVPRNESLNRFTMIE